MKNNIGLQKRSRWNNKCQKLKRKSFGNKKEPLGWKRNNMGDMISRGGSMIIIRRSLLLIQREKFVTRRINKSSLVMGAGQTNFS